MSDKLEIQTAQKYEAPKLEVYGEMAKLTEGGTSGDAESRRWQVRRRA